MARISQRAMNNVVIVAMLVMIALFNLDSFLPKPAVPSTRALLPEGAYVLKIEQGDNILERSGQQWRQKAQRNTLSVTPSQQLEEWQRAKLESISSLPESASAAQPYVVVVWLAGNSNGLVYAIYPTTTSAVIKFENKWYQLSNAELDTLLPWNQ